MPSRAWVVTIKDGIIHTIWEFQCPHGLELLHIDTPVAFVKQRFNALTGLSCYLISATELQMVLVSMPSRAWVVTLCVTQQYGFTAVSMPSRAWVVTARMSNILNFLWYFLCIPAIYRCILAYLPIFFNQLSKFLRCESPSTFLGTCLSHHSFIIFLVTNTNTLLSGLYFISTASMSNCQRQLYSCQCPLGLIPHFYGFTSLSGERIEVRVNALSGLYLISTGYPFISRGYETYLCVNALSGLYIISTISFSTFFPGTGTGCPKDSTLNAKRSGSLWHKRTRITLLGRKQWMLLSFLLDKWKNENSLHVSFG